MNNPCIRCGKQRIDGKSWKEKSGTSIVTHTNTICPDAACQKVLDKVIADRIAKNALIIKNKASLLLRNKETLLLRNKAEAKLAREKKLLVST